VRIDYLLSGLTPMVTIRVPVPWRDGVSAEARKSHALRCARDLIDHACMASGIASPQPPTSGIAKTLEDFVPPSLEGVAQELGLTKPSTQPKKLRTLA
jgi:hypothetical protein